MKTLPKSAAAGLMAPLLALWLGSHHATAAGLATGQLSLQNLQVTVTTGAVQWLDSWEYQAWAEAPGSSVGAQQDFQSGGTTPMMASASAGSEAHSDALANAGPAGQVNSLASIADCVDGAASGTARSKSAIAVTEFRWRPSGRSAS